MYRGKTISSDASLRDPRQGLSIQAPPPPPVKSYFETQSCFGKTLALNSTSHSSNHCCREKIFSNISLQLPLIRDLIKRCILKLSFNLRFKSRTLMVRFGPAIKMGSVAHAARLNARMNPNKYLVSPDSTCLVLREFRLNAAADETSINIFCRQTQSVLRGNYKRAIDADEPRLRR